MSYDLTDRVVFITGASSGIGRACAIEYHRAGGRVVAAARSLDKLRALAGEFDYSGSQAIKALKEEGITTILALSLSSDRAAATTLPPAR